MKERKEEGRRDINRIMKGEGVKGMQVFLYIEGDRDRVKEGGTVGRNKGREEEGIKERKVLEYKKLRQGVEGYWKIREKGFKKGVKEIKG